MEAARTMAEEYWANPGSSDATSLRLVAALGDRALANEIASRIDAHPGSALVICSAVVLSCQCGAPFDLDAAPNFKSRIEEAGFPWPPTKRIDYPAKNW
jgi:hypothetical protein